MGANLVAKKSSTLSVQLNNKNKILTSQKNINLPCTICFIYFNCHCLLKKYWGIKTQNLSSKLDWSYLDYLVHKCPYILIWYYKPKYYKLMRMRSSEIQLSTFRWIEECNLFETCQCLSESRKYFAHNYFGGFSINWTKASGRKKIVNFKLKWVSGVWTTSSFKK